MLSFLLLVMSGAALGKPLSPRDYPRPEYPAPAPSPYAPPYYGRPPPPTTSCSTSQAAETSFVTTTSYELNVTAPVTTTIAQPTGNQPETIVVERPPTLSTTTIYDPSLTVPSTSTRYTPGQPTGVVIVSSPAIYTTTTVYELSITSAVTSIKTSFNAGPPITTGVVEVDQPVSLTTSLVYDPSITAPETRTIYNPGDSTGTIVVTDQALYTTTTVYNTTLTSATTTVLTSFNPGPPVTTGVVEEDLPVTFTRTTVYNSDISVPETTTVYSGGPSGTVSITDIAEYTTTTVYDTALSSATTTILTSFNPGPPLTTGVVEVDQTVSLTTTTIYDPNVAIPQSSTLYVPGASSGTVFVTDHAVYTTLTSYGLQFTQASSSTATFFDAGPPVTTGEVDLFTSPALSTTTVYSNDPAFGVPSSTTDYANGASTGLVSVTAQGTYTTTTSYATAFTDTTTITPTQYNPGPPETTGLVEIDQPPTFITTDLYTDVPAITVTTSYNAGDPVATVISETPIYATSTSYGLSSTVITSVVGNPTMQGTIISILPATDAPVATSAPPQVSQSSGTVSQTTSQLPDVTPGPVTPAIPAPEECGNQGVEWAEYPNISGDWTPPQQPGEPYYPSWDPTQYKLAPPATVAHQGITDFVGGIRYAPTEQGNFTLYDGSQVNSDYFVLNHQGYIYPPQNGTYTFVSYYADDVVNVWLGPKAYAGWTRGNADLEQVYQDPPSGFTGFPGEPDVLFTADLVTGVYYPLRIIFGQAQRQAEFNFYITAPSGQEFLGPQTTASPYLVRFSCDRVTAPPFPDFGQQS